MDIDTQDDARWKAIIAQARAVAIRTGEDPQDRAAINNFAVGYLASRIVELEKRNGNERG